MNIILVHFFNNYSGSPNVLAVLAKGLLKKGHSIELITNRTEGFLSNIDGIKYHYVKYKWSSNKLISLYFFIFVQIQLFFRVMFMNHRALFYINTISPIGAIIGCAISKKKHIIHVHENMKKQTLLYCIYRIVYKKYNKKSVFVSYYIRKQAVGIQSSIVAYNGLNDSFVKQIKYTPIEKRSTILMLCSLRPYKGIFEFIELSKMFTQIRFELVVSESQKDVDLFCYNNVLPNNVVLFSSQKNVHSFYQRAKIVMNLSHPNECVETFGLTILEALAYGIPVIYPNVGGPLEVGQDQINGFAVCSTDIDFVASKIKQLLEDGKLYANMSHSALKRAQEFSSDKMVSRIEEYILL